MSDVTLDQAFRAAGEISEGCMALQLFAADLDDTRFSQDVSKILAARAAVTRIGDRLAQMRIDERVLRGTTLLEQMEANDRRPGPTLDGSAPSARQETE